METIADTIKQTTMPSLLSGSTDNYSWSWYQSQSNQDSGIVKLYTAGHSVHLGQIECSRYDIADNIEILETIQNVDSAIRNAKCLYDLQVAFSQAEDIAIAIEDFGIVRDWEQDCPTFDPNNKLPQSILDYICQELELPVISWDSEEILFSENGEQWIENARTVIELNSADWNEIVSPDSVECIRGIACQIVSEHLETGRTVTIGELWQQTKKEFADIAEEVPESFDTETATVSVLAEFARTYPKTVLPNNRQSGKLSDIGFAAMLAIGTLLMDCTGPDTAANAADNPQSAITQQ